MAPIIISAKVTLSATVLAALLGLFAARKTAKLRRGHVKSLLDGLLTLPMVLPPTVTGFLLLVIFGKNGLLGNTLTAIGFPIVFTIRGAVIAAAVVSFPLMYRAARGAFEALDPSLEEAARTMGYGEIRLFWQVTVPCTSHGVISGLVLTFARALGEFGATSLLAGNMPGKTQTIPLAIYSALSANHRDTVYVWVAITAGISLVSIFLLNQLTKKTK
ncbi:MAG: molybdate ABC transporter permease subunit [Oscillospiraceae bacterium]|jgi:molybdate transport system permease protein|nr:molybdate ABC transporter permease subunit [Oscillospiraceae bacterium]